jgi:hypothetical protein
MVEMVEMVERWWGTVSFYFKLERRIGINKMKRNGGSGEMVETVAMGNGGNGWNGGNGGNGGNHKWRKNWWWNSRMVERNTCKK